MLKIWYLHKSFTYLKVWMLLLFAGLQLHGQELITLRGAVINKETNKPIPYSSIGLIDHNIFTTSNSDGYFTFHIPQKHINDFIGISHVGYQKARYRIKDMVNKSTFYLTPKMVFLDEIIITDNPEKFAWQVVKQALERISEHYPTQAYVLEGYFRKTHKIDSSYVSFLDAAIKLFDMEFAINNKKKAPEAVLVEAVRKSYDLNNKPYRSWIDDISHESNWLARLLKRNDVRYQNGLLDKKNKYTLSGSILFNGELCYEIEVTKLPWRYTKATTGSLIKLVIGSKTYKIFRIVHEEMARENDFDLFGWGKQTNDTIFSAFRGGTKILEFKDIGGKLYLNYLRETHYVDDFSIQARKTAYSNVYSWELFINKVIENVDSDLRENMNFNNTRDNFKILDKPYDPDFWKSFNLVPFTAENKQAFKDLSVETEIEDQFKHISN
ncbi:carboxypeptidase-like regulatory domain-containing protein [Fulvivirgaceae bacterium BMA12]|uniref:Carboxypeptidase-like regulatory domain-containing protein n=1 Tax=Agaribacillus aureus TaxID=3051825 RepID=A0ABT8L0G5_9BACT|nr:carboxypeptidase-like regulatory domain-containing protein [Fulvivirgaceae bacterium BMA12]